MLPANVADSLLLLSDPAVLAEHTSLLLQGFAGAATLPGMLFLRHLCNVLILVIFFSDLQHGLGEPFVAISQAYAITVLK